MHLHFQKALLKDKLCINQTERHYFSLALYYGMKKNIIDSVLDADVILQMYYRNMVRLLKYDYTKVWTLKVYSTVDFFFFINRLLNIHRTENIIDKIDKIYV